MTWDLLFRLVALFGVIALGWVGARRRLLAGPDGLRALGNAAFLLFVPALLFRTMARVDLAALPWRLLAAFFVPVVGWLLLVWMTFFAGNLFFGIAFTVMAPMVLAHTNSNSLIFGSVQTSRRDWRCDWRCHHERLGRFQTPRLWHSYRLDSQWNWHRNHRT